MSCIVSVPYLTQIGNSKNKAFHIGVKRCRGKLHQAKRVSVHFGFVLCICMIYTCKQLFVHILGYCIENASAFRRGVLLQVAFSAEADDDIPGVQRGLWESFGRVLPPVLYRSLTKKLSCDPLRTLRSLISCKEVLQNAFVKESGETFQCFRICSHSLAKNLFWSGLFGCKTLCFSMQECIWKVYFPMLLVISWSNYCFDWLRRRTLLSFLLKRVWTCHCLQPFLLAAPSLTCCEMSRCSRTNMPFELRCTTVLGSGQNLALWCTLLWYTVLHLLYW